MPGWHLGNAASSFFNRDVSRMAGPLDAQSGTSLLVHVPSGRQLFVPSVPLSNMLDRPFDISDSVRE
jgi:hypothetical protein